MHPRIRYVGGVPIRLSVRRMAAQFFSLLDKPREHQQQKLLELLRLNADSEFSRQHGLDRVRTVAEFRRQWPVSDYEAFRPSIDRLRQGQTQALLGSRNRLLMFALTSGTTAETKYIPITQQFLNDYRRGWKVWGIRAFDDHPHLHLSDIVQMSSDHDQFRTAGGHPCGNISGLVSAMQSPLLKTMYAVPDIVSKIKDPELKYYTALRLAVANRRIGLIMTANPSTLVHLAQLAQKWAPTLIQDIAEGTVSGPADLPPEIRRGLRWRTGRDRSRAKELEQILSRSGRLALPEVWRQLTLLAVWTGGSAAAYLPAVRDWYGSCPIRDHGLSASEGRMTVPFGDESATGVLDISSHYFEFIPEAEYGTAQPTVLEAHELEPGQTYYILLTTSSGLYRYDIRDVVRCTGRLKSTPQIEFLNKGSHMSSVTGEKLAESQVVTAICLAQQQCGLRMPHFTLVPVWGNPPAYYLLVEQGGFAADEQRHQFARECDQQLQQQNGEYADKRASGRLGPLTVAALPDGTWQKFTRQRQSRLGGSIEQYKHPCLIGDLQFFGRFQQEYLTN